MQPLGSHSVQPVTRLPVSLEHSVQRNSQRAQDTSPIGRLGLQVCLPNRKAHQGQEKGVQRGERFVCLACGWPGAATSP